MRLNVFLGAGCFAIGLLALPAIATGQDAAPTAPRAADDSPCILCHRHDAEGLLQTKHAVRSDSRTPWGNGHACQACHGESAEHLKDFREKPTVVFGKTTPEAQRVAPCLTCHSGGNQIHWAGGAHARNDIACSDCHKSHKAVDPVLVASTSAGVCFDCHKEKRAASLRASTHPIRTGWMSCSSCHEPHGSVGEASLIKATVNQTCFTCHADKRGPYLWQHPPAAENCANCHDAHGTNNAPLLVTRMPFLCMQCHLSPFHGSNLFSGNNLPPATGGAQMLGSSCVNCHVKVHGSNHPSGARLTR